MHKIFCTKNAKKENLQHPVMDAVFFVQKSAKKYGKNKNSVYWMKKGRDGIWGAKSKKIKNKKKEIEKESEMLEAVRLRSAPKAP